MSIAEQAEQSEPEAPAPKKPTMRFAEVVELPTGESVYARLPNQFQHDDISIKARAAQARRMRQLRDPETDSFVVLDADMDDLLREGDKDSLVEEIIGRDWWRDHLEAIKDVQEGEPFSDIEDDMARLEEMLRKPEDERDDDEVGELERHVEAYNTAVEVARDERQRPRREALSARTIDDLVVDIREGRIAAQGKSAFNRTFSMWEMMLGTFHLTEHGDGKPHPTNRYFEDVSDVENGDPEVLSALATAFATLEGQFSRGAVGNG